MNPRTFFEKRSKSFIILVGFALIGVIGIIDFITGYEWAISVFYIIPISLITWFNNRRLGLAASFTSALVWFGADIATGHKYSNSLIPIWNSIIRLAFFVIITLLLSSLRKISEREKELSRTDYLTGAANSRHLNDLVQMEIYRLQRYKHPFSLAYIDLDNFKSLNDQFGHSIGNDVLCTIVNSARRNLRKTDFVARLGGDEFALLLPETNQETAQIVLSKVQADLLEEMLNHNCSITFSIGVITCISAPNTTDDLMKMADELMYSVKRDGKNAIKYSTFTG